MEELHVHVPDSLLTSDVTVSLVSAVDVSLPLPGNHGDGPDNDLSAVGSLEETDNDKSTVLCVEDSEGVPLSNGNDNEVIQMLLPQEGVSDGVSGNLDLPDTSILAQNQQGPMQAVTLADGSTAYIQHKKGATKFLEGQAVTLEDGSTAIVQGSSPLKDNTVQSIQADIPETKFIDGQAVQLEDGTTAFIHNAHKGEGFQAIQLEDGTTAYLASNVAEGLFAEAASLDTSAIPLGQLEAQTPISDVSNSQNTSGSTTVTIISAPEGLADNTLVLTDKTYRCTFEGCGRLYTTHHHLKVHERNHTGDRPFKCEHPGCAKAFATGYGLKSHNRVHTGEKPYKCSDSTCIKAFKTSGDLQKHLRTHTGERPFKCPFEGCDRCFTTSNIRKVHIRTHTGERPYVCTEVGCGRAFASATNYKNHIRIHTGEKPYVCTVQNCGKRFTEYSSLYKHHVVHTHAKPYECNHCNKNYRQTSTLAMHKRTAHNEDITAEAEAMLYAQQSAELGDMSEMKRARLTINPVNDANLGDTAQGQVGDQEGALVINTTQAMTLQDLQQQGIASVSMGEAGQIFVVTDPAQLEALQQLAAQQLELQPTGSVDVLGSIDIIAEPTPPGTIIESASENSTLLHDPDPGE